MEKRAFRAFQTLGEGTIEQSCSVVEKAFEQLSEVTIRVHYSSLNYKDALSASGHRGVSKHYPHTPGIDAAGVIESISQEIESSSLSVGDEVIVTGFDLGMNTSGGFSEYITVPAEWVVKKPAEMSMLDSMMLGTAGLTAGMAIDSLLQVGITPSFGEIAVTGATGGVGSLAIMLLSHLGFRAVAITGKSEERDYLMDLGASEVLLRDQFLADSSRPLLKERWGGAIDTLGGEPLMTLLKGTRYGGSVTCCGMAASPEFKANVYPFILRGINLLGIESATLPMPIREEIWNNFAAEWRLSNLSSIVQTITLDQLTSTIAAMLDGTVKGRTVVDLTA